MTGSTPEVLELLATIEDRAKSTQRGLLTGVIPKGTTALRDIELLAQDAARILRAQEAAALALLRGEVDACA